MIMLMKNALCKNPVWTAALLVAATANAEAQESTDHLSFYTNYVSIYTNRLSISTNDTILANRLSLSARFGFNISGRFKDIGNRLFTVPAPNPRRTLDGDPYNYDDGYMLTDTSGSLDSLTSY